MPTDVNVTEKVARALYPSAFDPHSWPPATFGQSVEEARAERLQDAMDDARRALAVLSDPEVLDGMTGVLRAELAAEGGEPGSSLHSWRCEHPDMYGPCDCLAQVSASQATALADWLRGQG